ncbi:MAG TPA: hypothetical protein VK611_12710 [Acidimicrobiales bacterium]|nr:hypothetical protein [Acidimicrobiales bacterium]
MSLLWAVPAVAVTVAVAVLLSRLRTLEELSLDLARSVRRTSELRPPIAAVRRELNRSGPVVDRLWSHWDDGDAEQPVNSPDAD